MGSRRARRRDLVSDPLDGQSGDDDGVVHAELLRQPDGDGVENGPRAYLLARRPTR
jgi:hypothetical protein